MKKILFFLSCALFAYCIIGCNDKDDPTPEPPKPEPKPEPVINTVSQFVYDGLATYYLWAENMEDKKPTVNDSNPETYFKSVLYKTDTEHHWSWITDNIDGLLGDFAGESLSFGYKLKFLQDKTDYKIYAFIKYVFANTPASEAGMERLHLIGEINGHPIGTEQRDGETYIAKADIDVLYGNGQATYTLYKYGKGLKPIKDKDVTVTPTKINTNPVLLDSVYEVGDKKIGYLFYTGFISNYNDKLYEAFSKFKNENVTDLVLDLRYNHGGAISAASYLTSMIAPLAAVQGKETLSTLSYNKLLNEYFDKKGWSRSSKLGNYDTSNEQNPIEVNLNLNKVYVIATDDSFSASELTTFCLKPFMDVVHIGSKTGGKYTASWTLHAYNSFPDEQGHSRVNTVYDEKKISSADKNALKNWGMQPIVAIYTDKNNKTFIETDGLIPDYELDEGAFKDWAPLGDTKDVLLGQAFYLITGDEKYKPQASAGTRSISDFEVRSIRSNEPSLANEIQKESVIIDKLELTPENLEEIMELRK